MDKIVGIRIIRTFTTIRIQTLALGWCCIPLVAESYGAWGKEAIDSFKMLASRLAITSGKTKSAVLSELYSRLNLHLVRANATAILSRWLPS